MQLGMIGLGRMGANMVARLLDQGHHCVVYDRNADAINTAQQAGAIATSSIAELCAQLTPPRAVWIMVPAAAVDSVIDSLIPELSAGDCVIDGGNSYYKDAIRRAQQLTPLGIDWIDCGTSGGIWGRERGYCLMLGGNDTAIKRLDPIFATLAAPAIPIPPAVGSDTHDSATRGYLHCGANGAGHFVKMVHNGIEYGLMAAYAEGFNLLKHANVGCSNQRIDAETAPLNDPAAYSYEFDLARIAELWRHGSVVSSWLLDLAAIALHHDPDLHTFKPQVADSGEGRWTSIAAIETGTPAPVLTAALFERFQSRGEDQFANQLLAALRHQFGGH
ncbi:phosphogluconate dehydrogenase (NAD(+)-dependent, decarboxylating) [Thiospirillum jenense]|uniref:Decarboxylating 6-phosphogluconate dehydrogenase n=1 Tax=Thiospirillum jenense TaxID=1653858 RepID=A0A839HCE7_9GAMM|nr:decarboxylating 6-phosphogluconate dehydrogenase [Thiospirillum jenense]MBB1126341.1 decarboxylating 6-phosphogluconate dehydrogenase [Thiospirillum jenense]